MQEPRLDFQSGVLLALNEALHLHARGIRPPGGSAMNGMNLSGKPGMVQPMQMPPTLGQPPMPAIHPRLGTLQLTTGPQQPSFTMHLGEPYSSAKSPCS